VPRKVLVTRPKGGPVEIDLKRPGNGHFVLYDWEKRRDARDRQSRILLPHGEFGFCTLDRLDYFLCYLTPRWVWVRRLRVLHGRHPKTERSIVEPETARADFKEHNVPFPITPPAWTPGGRPTLALRNWLILALSDAGWTDEEIAKLLPKLHIKGITAERVGQIRRELAERRAADHKPPSEPPPSGEKETTPDPKK
jgi:hypothetical protein